MADEVYQIVVNDSVAATIERKLIAIANQADRAETSISKLKATMKGFNSGKEFSDAASSVTKLSRSMTLVNTDAKALTGSLAGVNRELAKTAGASGRAVQGLNNTGKAAQNAKSKADALKSALGTVGTALIAAFSIQAVAGWMDTATNVANTIGQIATSAEDLAKQQQQIYDLANATRVPVDQLAKSYTQFTKILAPLGKSQEEILRFTETLSKGFQLAGADANTASATIRQLGQALQNGTLRGDEFNSVMDQAPVELIAALADELGVSTTELRKMAEQGKITTDVLFNGIGKAATTIDEAFARMTPTIGGALTVLNNKFSEFFSGAQLAGKIVSGAILLIADNLNFIIPIVAAFVAGWTLKTAIDGISALAIVLKKETIPSVLALSKALFTQLIPAMVRLTIATITNPFVLLGVIFISLGIIIAKLTGQLDGLKAALTEGFEQVKGFIGGQETFKAAIDFANTALGGQSDALQNNTAATAGNNAELNRMSSVELPAVAGSAEAATGAINGFTAATANGIVRVVDLGSTATEVFDGMHGAGVNVISMFEALDGAANQTGSTTVRAGADMVQALQSVKNQGTSVIDMFRQMERAAQLAANAARDAAAAAARSSGTPSPNAGNGLGGGYFGQTASTSNYNSANNLSGSSSSIIKLPGHAQGGAFKVGGRQGRDKNLVAFRATRGEEVAISTSAQKKRGGFTPPRGWAAGGGGMTAVFNIVNPQDPDGFRRSRGQMASQARSMLRGA